MNCPQCKTEMVKSQMLFGTEFDYCRKCRKELSEMRQPTIETNVVATRAFYNLCNVDNTPPYSTELRVLLNLPKITGRGGFTPIPSPPPPLFWSIPPQLTTIQYPPFIWLPKDAPTADDNFYGINRSQDSIRLSGCRYSFTAALNTRDALTTACAYTNREGGKSSHLFLYPDDYTALRSGVGLPGDEKSFNFTGPQGYITVLPDIDTPKNLGYLLQLNTWARTDVFGTYCTTPGSNCVIILK